MTCPKTINKKMLWVAVIAASFLFVPGHNPPVQAETTELNTSWSLTAVGDIMLDRNVWAKIKTYGKTYPFTKIADQLKGADAVLGNLEGPFTSSSKHAVSGGALLFNFDPVMAPILKQSGLTLLSLANNHTLNQGQAGLDNTRRVLKNAKLQYFGDPKNRTGYALTKTFGGRKVTFIGYDQLDGLITNVLKEVRAAHRRGEYVIVVPHWGAEYKLGVQRGLQIQAHQLIDAGADMILGGHPHVVEPLEVYKGKFIAYSLGNFIFDQYFSTDTQQGLMLKINFTNTQVQIRIIPLESLRSQIKVAGAAVKTKLLNRIATGSPNSAVIKNQVKKGLLTLVW